MKQNLINMAWTVGAVVVGIAIYNYAVAPALAKVTAKA